MTEALVNEFRGLLERRVLCGSSTVAVHAAEILSRLIQSTPATLSVKQLSLDIRRLGRTLERAAPQELAVGNIVRRVLFALSNESTLEEKEPSAQLGLVSSSSSRSLHTLLDLTSESPELDDSLTVGAVRSTLLGIIDEMIAELGNVYSRIADQAIEYIHSSEVIMTAGRSNTLVRFLAGAKDFRKFQVFVAESAPGFVGQSMAIELSKAGIDSTLITDSAVFALMSRMNKVVVGAHAILANGGLIVHTGIYNIALAAKYYNVDFLVVTGLYKLCPIFAFHQDTINDYSSPESILGYTESILQEINVENPKYEYVPPELVTLLITNDQGYHPSYIYRLLSEFYRQEDYTL
jgi:translation initiation factor eIF-2B subunit beta